MPINKNKIRTLSYFNSIEAEFLMAQYKTCADS